MKQDSVKALLEQTPEERARRKKARGELETKSDKDKEWLRSRLAGKESDGKA